MSPLEQPPTACETNAFRLPRFLKKIGNKKAAHKEPLGVVFTQQQLSGSAHKQMSPLNYTHIG
jgi:hypothetical protein